MADLTIKQAQAKLARKAEEATRQLIVQAGRDIIRRTPVVTGKTISNWMTARFRPRRRLRKRFSNEKAIALDMLDRTMNRFKMGNRVFITNGLWHVRLLEDGSENTRPRGMVKLAVAGFKLSAARIAAMLRRK